MHPVSFAGLTSVCILLAPPSAVLARSRIRPAVASIGADTDTAAARGPYYILGGAAVRPLEHPTGARPRAPG